MYKMQKISRALIVTDTEAFPVYVILYIITNLCYEINIQIYYIIINNTQVLICYGISLFFFFYWAQYRER